MLKGVFATLAGVVAAACVAAAPAGAAVATQRVVCESGNKGCMNVTHVEYRAAPGELNDVSITQDGARFTISDVVPIEAQAGCVQEAATRITCAGSYLDADLGDGNDAGRATGDSSIAVNQNSLKGGAGDDTLTAPRSRLDGGDGNDHVTGSSAGGGAGRDVITGTHGVDYLEGGDDEDELSGGAGDDNLNGGTDHASDVMDGGDGADTLDFRGRRDPVEVDLAAQTGGYPGEHDRLSSFENAMGGLGADRLVGDEGPNVLDGGTEFLYEMTGGPGDVIFGAGGDDRLRGGFNSSELHGGEGDDLLNGGTGGRDLLDGGPGDDLLGGGLADTFDGGDGDDRLDLSRGGSGAARGAVGCGAGRDDVASPGLALLPPDCETVSQVYFHSPIYPRRAGRRDVELRVDCPRPRPSCSGRVTLRVAGQKRPIAQAAFRRKAGRARVKLRLPARIARRRDSVPVRVAVAGKQAHGGVRGVPFGTSWYIDLGPVLRGA
jgi:hypothetical protein